MRIVVREVSPKVSHQTARDPVGLQSSGGRTPYDLDLSESCAACTYCTGCFCGRFSPAELKDFDALMAVSAYPAEAVLFLEQERTKGIYVLCKGEVKLSFSSSDGKTLLLKIATSGEVLGLLSALTGNCYEATAETLRPCRVAFISGSDFHKFLRRHPNVFQSVAKQLASQYRTACEQLCAVGLGRSMLEKVARFLLTWSRTRGAPENGIPFTLPLNHEEIGECVGATRESVSRALSEFRSRGLIESCGATVVIHNRAALAAVRNRRAKPQDLDAHLVRWPRPVRYSAPPRAQRHSWTEDDGQRRRA